jgi:predicted DNA-binding transcriptional regulator AlpA
VYVRIGRGRVLYRMSDVSSWIENQAMRAS